MQDPANEFRRIPLLGSSVNRGWLVGDDDLAAVLVYHLFMVDSPKRKRGRPRKIPEPELSLGRKLSGVSEGLRQRAGVDVPAKRTLADRYYADHAREVVRELSERVHIPEDPVFAARRRAGLDWVLKRKTILSEVGRMIVDDPSQSDIERFQDVLVYIADRHDKITAREAAAYARTRRLGKATSRKDRIQSLHHALNAAINQHRHRFPESSWADVQKALEYTASQVARKL